MDNMGTKVVSMGSKSLRCGMNTHEYDDMDNMGTKSSKYEKSKFIQR